MSVDEQGNTGFRFNQPMIVPDGWQNINFDSSFRFILSSSDGSQVLGTFLDTQSENVSDTAQRNLVVHTRFCIESITCEAQYKSFNWQVD